MNASSIPRKWLSVCKLLTYTRQPRGVKINGPYRTTAQRSWVQAGCRRAGHVMQSTKEKLTPGMCAQWSEGMGGSRAVWGPRGSGPRGDIGTQSVGGGGEGRLTPH